MRLSIERKPVRVNPDSKRVIARFFFNGNDRAKEVIQRVRSTAAKYREEMSMAPAALRKRMA